MTEFETVPCESCGEDFTAHPSAMAADNGFCSPRCESEGKGL